MLKFVRCLAAAVIGATLATSPVAAQPSAEPAAGAASFTIFFRSTPAGVERVSLDRSPEGWTIRSSGQLSAPFNLTNREFVVEYDLEWRPRRLTMEGGGQNREFLVTSSFVGDLVTNRVRDGGQDAEAEEPFDPTSVVVPDYFFGSYEALAVRLNGAAEGDRIPVYVAPRGPTEAVVRETLSQRLESPRGQLTARIVRLTFENPEQALDAEIWIDERHRLLRVNLPGVGLDVVRQDISLVSTRLSGVEVPGDTDVRVAVVGFSLAATITVPVDQTMPADGWPAVLLVPGTRSSDRDEHLSGVPLYGQLAAVLSEAGYVVARYDRRGVGQSGGRPESANLEDYGNDARAVVRYLEDRDDVDHDRIAVLAHGEGGWIGLQAASREDRIAALVLLATPAVDGSTLVLEQQQAELDRMDSSAQEREERRALQHRIHDAVLGNGTWDEIPEEFRRQADTQWFRSFLEFDPADIMRRVRQPLLIVHGERDQQIPIHHADRLAQLAEQRSRDESTVELSKIPDIDHLMVTAAAGPTADYEAVSDVTIAPAVTDVLTDWLQRTVRARP